LNLDCWRPANPFVTRLESIRAPMDLLVDVEIQL
jgi:hypothetical protein